MKFQVFLIAVVVLMTGGAIMVAQSVPSGYHAGGAPINRLQIPPAVDTNIAAEPQTGTPPSGASAALAALPSSASATADRTDAESAGTAPAGCGTGRHGGGRSSLGVHLAVPSTVAARLHGDRSAARCASAGVGMGKVRRSGDDDNDTEADD